MRLEERHAMMSRQPTALQSIRVGGCLVETASIFYSHMDDTAPCTARAWIKVNTLAGTISVSCRA